MACTFCLGFGKWLPSYKYIVFLIIFNVLKDFTFGSHEVEYFQYLKIADCGPLNNCNFIHEMFCYLLTFVVGLYLYNKESQDISRNSIEYSFKKLENKMTENQTLDINLIHNEPEAIDYPNKYLFMIILWWVLNEEALNYFSGIFIHMDFWMVEIIILTIFMTKMLKLNVYRHQKSMIGLILFPLILKVGTIIISHFDDGSKNKKDSNFQYRSIQNKLKIIFVAIPWLYFCLPLYFFLLGSKCYINTKIKWLIDLKNIPWKKILCIYSLFGTIFCLIVSLVATFLVCGENDAYVNDIKEYFCKVKYDINYNNNDNNKYLESFKIYFRSDISSLQILLEIITVIIGSCAFAWHKTSFLNALEHLTPIHLIFAIPAHYLINKFYLLILNVIKNKDHSAIIPDSDNGHNYFEYKISMDFLSDAFSVFGYLVYLEVIELKCCNFDKDIRRKVLARGIIDLYKADPNNSSNSDNPNIGRTSSTGNISNSSLNDSYF